MSTRHDIFARNARSISASLPGLAGGMNEVTDEQLNRMVPVMLPHVAAEQLEGFAAASANQTVGDALVLLGLGSPELLRVMRRLLPPDRALIVVEPTLDLVLRLLSQHDFSDVFEQDYTAIVFGADDRSLLEELTTLVSNWGLHEIQLIVNPMRPLGDDVAQLVAGVLRDAIRAVDLRTSTAAAFTEQLVASIVNNLEPAISAYDISPLADALKGVPAFCVAAGPSLDDDISHLRRAHEYGIIIAADAAVPPLVKAGITPDIVTTIDVIEKKAGIFEQYYVKDALLLALLSAHTNIVSAWIGPRAFAVDGHPLAQWAAPLITPPSRFGSLGSVAHLSMALARGLGCDPVVLVGTDLAVAHDGRSYAKGITHHDAKDTILSPKDLAAKTIEVMANDGERTHTFENMASYIRMFTALAAAGGRAYSTALHGARIPGIPYRALEDVLDELPTQIISRPLVGRAPSREQVAGRRVRLLAATERLQSSLTAYAHEARQFAEAAEAVRERLQEEAIDAEEAVKSLHPQVERLAAHAEAMELIEPLHPAVTVELNRLARKSRGVTNPIERAHMRLVTLAGASASGGPLAELVAGRLDKLITRLSRLAHSANKTPPDSHTAG